MGKLVERLRQSTNEEISNLIFENAICSMRHGLDHYIEKDPHNTNYKYTIIHLAHSLELMLKSVLAKENRFLIIKNLDNKKKDHTANVLEITERLNNLFLVKFSKKEKIQITAIRDIRNMIEHFVFEENKDKLDNIVNFIVSYWFSFVKRYLDYDLSQCLTPSQLKLVLTIDKQHELLLNASYSKLKKETSLAKSKNIEVIIEICDNCFEEVVFVNLSDNVAKCLYCEEEYDLNNCDNCGKIATMRSSYDMHAFCLECTKYPDEDWKIWADR